jgi:hypothetical protein
VGSGAWTFERGGAGTSTQALGSVAQQKKAEATLKAVKTMKRVTYDSGVLVAADRNERRVWAEHRVRLEAGNVPLVPAAVVAQASRSPKQAQLRRLLRGCEIVPLDEASAHAVGRLLALTKTSDVVDAVVAQVGAKHRADIVTSNPDDIRPLVAAARAKVAVIEI